MKCEMLDARFKIERMREGLWNHKDEFQVLCREKAPVEHRGKKTLFTPLQERGDVKHFCLTICRFNVPWHDLKNRSFCRVQMKLNRQIISFHKSGTRT